jgi:hypothetical protein
MGKYAMQEKKPKGRSMKSRMNIERITVPIESPRIARFHRQVLNLQDTHHSAQKKVTQLTKELQLRTNKPEYHRRCQKIRKELCKRIDDTVWKQKNYERENNRLQKMENRRTFTRIERAFTATTVIGDTPDESNLNNISSQSSDQGSVPKLPTKLSTKEKIRQMQAMLQQLEHEVEEATEHDGWDDSDDETNTKPEQKEDEDRKTTAIKTTGENSVSSGVVSGACTSIAGQNIVQTEPVVNSVQAKLAKELIKLANTYKVPKLIFSDQAGRRCFGYQTWFNKLHPILAMFPETSEVIQGDKIIPFRDVNCVGNKTLYLVIGSRVDAYFQ